MNTTRYEGEIPPHIVDNLQRGVEPHEKRVVLNLAKVSRIVAHDNGLAGGRIRVYDDFVSDWRYDRSEWVAKEECTLCGKKNIREACHIVDDEQEVDIIVGNECVHKHIEITTDGINGLTGDAKRDFLRTAMREAKEAFFASQWKREYPHTTEMMEAKDAMMHHLDSVTRPSFRQRSPEARYNAIKRGLDARGYLSVKTDAYKDFMAAHKVGVEALVIKFTLDMSMKDVERSRLYAEAAHRRTMRTAMAHAFRVKMENAYDAGTLTTADMGNVASVESALRTYGPDNLRGWNQSNLTYLENKVDGKISIDTDTLNAIEAIPRGALNDWEQSFMESITARLNKGLTLSTKQDRTVKKIIRGASV
jgi:hypothetical protein